MLTLIHYFHQRAARIVKKGALVVAIRNLPVTNTLIRMKMLVPNDELDQFDTIQAEIDQQMDQLEKNY